MLHVWNVLKENGGGVWNLRRRLSHIMTLCPFPTAPRGLPSCHVLCRVHFSVLQPRWEAWSWIDVHTYVYSVFATELVALLFHILKLAGSYFGSNRMSCWRSSWCSSAPPGRFQDCSWNWVTVASFNPPFNSLRTNHCIVHIDTKS